MDLQDQITAYTAWINSQLKKRSQQIDDLSLDLNDGVVLATVVEIVSGQKIDAVKPSNNEEKRENLQKIVKFMASNGIKLHHVSIEEIIAGNVKAIMQLILALAAHFKPASIGGRKHNHTDKFHRSPVTISKNRYRWKKDESNIEELNESENKLQMELQTDVNEVKNLAENLQKLLLNEIKTNPIENPHPYEESSILRAKLEQALSENVRLQGKLDELRTQLHSLETEKSVFESRVHHHEEEILNLKQSLLSSDMEKDKMISEKADLHSRLQDSLKQRDRLAKQGHKKDVLIQEMADELHFVKTEEVILLARKDREVAQLQKRISNGSNFKDQSDHQDQAPSATIIKLPSSPLPSRNPGLIIRSPSPNSLLRTKLGRNNHTRKSRQTVSIGEQTRVLYFHDRDMTPSRTTIPKRVEDITLKDFKDATKKDGNFRYIFKSLDPELGTVKEEVFRDDDIVPGWEGKIVAWIEEEVRV